MHLLILGCYGPYPPAGGACSGYLVQEDNYTILLDCGNGVLSRLQHHFDFRALKAVIISHLHADHVSDLMIMRYGLEIAFKKGLRSSALPLYAPAEPGEEFLRLPYKNAYQVEKINTDVKLQLGPFTVSFCPGVHAVPAYAIKVQSGPKTLVYSGDTEYHEAIAEFVKGADLFLCEANYLDEDLQAGLANHLSAAQAAELAAGNKVKRLILTHHYPERDPALTLAEAVRYFPTAELAAEDSELVV